MTQRDRSRSDLLHRLKQGGTTSPADALAAACPPRLMIEDFRPLTESLEWRLSDHHWKHQGVSGFIEGGVPFIVNNDGWLSLQAAAVLYTNCLDAPADGPIYIAEPGAGTGLFARFLLDAFQEVCESNGRDFYNRLVYVVTDASPATVEFWGRNGVFEPHARHVRLEVCAAGSLGDVAPAPVRAIFCNYILDSLPAAVVRRGSAGWEQVHVRTWITAEEDRRRQYSSLPPDKIRALAASPGPDALDRLLPILPALELEGEFRPVTEPLPGLLRDFAPAEASEAVAFNHGAMEFLDRTAALVEPGGFLLLNDYAQAPMPREEAAQANQRFGSAVALGLNLPVLDAYAGAAGFTVHVPEGDDSPPVHARLLLRGTDTTRTARQFATRFASEARGRIEQLAEKAREHAWAGRWRDAFHTWREALRLNPFHWVLMREAAEHAGELGDASAGVNLALAALERNPWYSSSLWNTLGENLVRLERFEDAHLCFLEAHRLHARDPKTNLLLAESWLRRSQPEETLDAVAAGLACDQDNMFRHLMLERQREALDALQTRWTRERALQAGNRYPVPGPASADDTITAANRKVQSDADDEP